MIFDTGALLAILYQEPGAAKARELLLQAKMSAVNRAEALTVLVRDGMPGAEADFHVTALLSHIVPFDTRQSTLLASLWPGNSPYGLSLGDRACLTLGLHLGEPVLTTHGEWRKLGLPLDIQFLE